MELYEISLTTGVFLKFFLDEEQVNSIIEAMDSSKSVQLITKVMDANKDVYNFRIVIHGDSVVWFGRKL